MHVDPSSNVTEGPGHASYISAVAEVVNQLSLKSSKSGSPFGVHIVVHSPGCWILPKTIDHRDLSSDHVRELKHAKVSNRRAPLTGFSILEPSLDPHPHVPDLERETFLLQCKEAEHVATGQGLLHPVDLVLGDGEVDHLGSPSEVDFDVCGVVNLSEIDRNVDVVTFEPGRTHPVGVFVRIDHVLCHSAPRIFLGLHRVGQGIDVAIDLDLKDANLVAPRVESLADNIALVDGEPEGRCAPHASPIGDHLTRIQGLVEEKPLLIPLPLNGDVSREEAPYDNHAADGMTNGGCPGWCRDLVEL
mmetsp:Transcript_54634/g.128304  ORF Transcript_54634/g.128304 Transcript_54634/m.128304 type:complete len:303 (-) Transcript_54634:1489-2397(-)